MTEIHLAMHTISAKYIDVCVCVCVCAMVGFADMMQISIFLSGKNIKIGTTRLKIHKYTHTHTHIYITSI